MDLHMDCTCPRQGLEKLNIVGLTAGNAQIKRSHC